MKKKLSPTVFLAQAAMIAALYIVLTFIANALGLANYAIQVRFSEALTILPYFLRLQYPVCSQAVCSATFLPAVCHWMSSLEVWLLWLVLSVLMHCVSTNGWHHFRLSLRTSLSYLWYYPMFISLKAACLISH